VGNPDALRLDRNDGQVVHTARIATSLAAQSLGVMEGEFARANVDPLVDFLH